MKLVTRSLLALSIVLSLGACSSTNSGESESYANQTNAEGDDGMVCKMEKKIGSNRMSRVCYTVEEREVMEETAKEGWFRSQRTYSTGGGDGR